MLYILNNPLIITIAIFIASLFLTFLVYLLVSILEKRTIKKKKRKNIEIITKKWNENQKIREEFLKKYSISESVFDLKDNEKDVVIISFPYIVSGIYIYRSPSSKYNDEPWIPYPNPAIIFIDHYAICTHTFNHCLQVVENLKNAGTNVAADPHELEEKLFRGKL